MIKCCNEPSWYDLYITAHWDYFWDASELKALKGADNLIQSLILEILPVKLDFQSSVESRAYWTHRWKKYGIWKRL